MGDAPDSDSAALLSVPLIRPNDAITANAVKGCDEHSAAFGRQFAESNETLIRSVDRASYWILYLCGFVWEDACSVGGVCHNLWNCVIYACLLVPALYFSTQFVGVSTTRENILNWTIAIALIFQVGGVIGSTYYNGIRLRRCKHFRGEATALRSARFPTILSIIVAIGGTIVFPICVIQDFTYFVFLPVVIVNGINVQFLLADSTFAVRALTAMCDGIRAGKVVSLQEVGVVRSRVRETVRRSHIPTTFLMATALTNLVFLFAAVVIYSGFEKTLIDLFFIIFFKEIVFAVMGLYYAACVNEAGKECASALGERLSAADVEHSMKSTQIALVLNSLQACPIEFPVVGMVLTRKELALRFSLWLFGIVLSVVTKD